MTEHEDLSRELEAEADRLQSASEHLGDSIGDARADLHRKQADSGVPGVDPTDHVLAGDTVDGEDDEAAGEPGGEG